MAPPSKERLLRYAAQARRDGILSLLNEKDLPDLFAMVLRKMIEDGDDKGAENVQALVALQAIFEGQPPEELDRRGQALPAGLRW